MYKKHCLIVLLIPFIISIPIVTTESLITAGDTLTFRVLKSRIHAEVGDNFIETKKIAFRSESFSEGKKVLAKVNFVGDGMNGEFVIGNTSRPFGYTTGEFKIQIKDYLFISTYFSYILADNWERESFGKGYYFSLYPYIMPHGTSWYFILGLESYISSQINSYENVPGYTLQNETFVDNNDDSIYFESWNGGRIDSSNGFLYGFTEGIPANLSFGNQFQIAFDKTSGLCKGMRYRGWSEGTINNEKIELSLDFHYEAINYNLPRIIFGSYSDFFGKKIYFTFLICLLPVILTPILVNKIKKKKVTIGE